jgi:hypothetical protein
MIGYWSFGLGHGYWSLAIGYAYWPLAIDIYTKNVAMVITHFGYCPFSMAMFITHWLLAIVH